MKQNNLTFNELPEAVSELQGNVQRILDLLQKDEDHPKNGNSEKFLNIHEAALFLKLAPQTLYGLVSRKKIPVMKQGRLYFSRQDLINWIESGKMLTREEIAETSRPTLIKRTVTPKSSLQ